MLWFKAWKETRIRFLIALAILALFACGTVLEYPTLRRLAASITTGTDAGAIGRAVSEARQVQQTYRGFVWWQFQRQNLCQIWTLFAVLLAAGTIPSRRSSGALYTMSLPASRRELLGVRVWTALAELGAIAVIPSLLIPILSPVVGQSYSVVDALVHAACVVIAGSAFFGLTLLSTSMFEDRWQSSLLVIAVVLAAGFVEGLTSAGIFSVMSGASYFYTGRVPWAGLLLSAAAAAAFAYGAALRFERREF